MEFETAIKMELSSDCTCEYYDDEDNLVPSNDCWGCWDDSATYFNEEFFPEWLKAKGLTAEDTFRIDGYAMGWMRQNGSIDLTADKVLDALALRGDFRLVFTLDGGVLRGMRYSHDEPTGASFVFVPMI